ncbi:DUF5682 family protein [Rhizomonospora bruguierae]|uniref:DUF5682 family protein n=1 Tax=Rhizomonospora bruguierae TaxID=1581705 RepID=UPI0020C0CB10|nr:DUF5682 family protein [Micromonospora sp. NBRC 107566]
MSGEPPDRDAPATVLLGIRHHGPGSARAVRRALAAYRPEVVLIEGPPEADSLVAYAASPQLRPPVALLAYADTGRPAPGKPAPARSAVFWPFAEFSPEWQAIRWAVDAGVPVRFCDLPAANRLALGDPTDQPAKNPTDQPAKNPTDPAAKEGAGEGAERPAREGTEKAAELGAEEAAEPGAGKGATDGAERGAQKPVEEGAAERAVPASRVDPIGALAEAAGYDDPERWWEDVIEHRLEEATAGEDELSAALAPFQAIAEAMAEVRAAAPALPEAHRVDEERREAVMRNALRAAAKRYRRVAVVCGAWHVPALARAVTAAADARTLKGLPKVRAAVTWVPWTHGRLVYWPGYGAGVASPGWYHHLFTAPDEPVTRWLVEVARVLRAEGFTPSSAHVIEAVRLAEALATLRARPLAGLAEVTEATRAVLCDGDELRLRLVHRRLVVGERLGTVPADAPAVPLARDVAARQRRLRLPPSPLESIQDLDLRKENDLARSHLLHRLRLLGVGWGTPAAEGRRGKGTFWESWELRWRPEFAVDLVAASPYGTTVPAAATAKAVEEAAAATSLGEVTALVERCLLADLPAALPVVLRALDERIALDADVTHLMAALPALARSLRYGDVRGTDLSALREVTTGLVVRACVGLAGAVTGLDEAAARQVRAQLDAVDGALGLLADPALRERWLATLAALVDRPDLPGLLAGRISRLLLDAGRLDRDDAGRRMARALTLGVPPARAAAWVEGFLAGSGLLLVHDDRLLALVDAWLAGIPAELFTEVLPLLRRTFGTFAEPERRAVGERIRAARPGSPPTAAPDDDVDPERGALVLPTVELLLGKGAAA